MKLSNELFVTPHKDSVEISSDGESVMILVTQVEALRDALTVILNEWDENYYESLKTAAREAGSWEQLEDFYD